MEKEFIPYEQALALKELGFDKPCIAMYEHNTKKLKPRSGLCPSWFNDTNDNDTPERWFMSAPLYQQAFRWFREKYKLFPLQTGNEHYTAFSLDMEFLSFVRANKNPNHFEEAELECLNKLIEIIKIKYETSIN